MAEEKIFLFYSSETEPEILEFYWEAISLLKEMKKEIHIIDIFKNQKIARKWKVTATPTLFIKRGFKKKEYFGIVDGMKDLLKTDLFGKSVIHTMSYKEGREYAKVSEVDDLKIERIEQILQDKLSTYEISTVKIYDVDRDKGFLKLDITPRIKGTPETMAIEISPFLGGFFMEYFCKTVYANFKKLKDKNIMEFTVE